MEGREIAALGLFGGMLGLVLARLRKARDPDYVRPTAQPEDVVELAEGTSTEPIAYGTLQEVAPLLREYEDYLRSQGVNLDWFSAEELTKLSKTGKYAIPPKHLWDEMVRTIIFAAQPIRQEFGDPIRIYNAYRPRWYNKMVKGAKGSLHIRNAALDLIPYEYSQRRRLAEIAARYIIENGDKYRMGMGIYNYPNMTGVHVDALVRKRRVTYAATRKWMRHVRVAA